MNLEQKKQFLFVNLQNQEATTLLEKVIVHGQYIDISFAIKSFNDQFGDENEQRTFLYKNIELPIQVEGIEEPVYFILQDQDIIDKTTIKIQYKNSFESEEQDQEGGKQRSKERTIKEVLMGVQKWRNLHDPKIKGKQRLSLQDAAKQVGFSKKSLDDYYCQLRVAETYNFDFMQNLDQKIGILRNFVKNNRKSSKTKSKKKAQKLSKKLMIIQTTDFGEDNELVTKQPTKQQNAVQKQEKQVHSMSLLKEEQFQNQFYRDLFLIDTEIIDPFVPFRSNDYKPFESFSFDSQ